MSLFDILSTQRITANNATLIGTLTTANINATGNINLSSINNAVYPPPPSSNAWVGTATSALNMANYNINSANTVNAITVQLGANIYGTTTITGGSINTGAITTTAVNTTLINGQTLAPSYNNIYAEPYTAVPTVSGGYYITATIPGVYSVQSTTSDPNVQLDIYDSSNIPGWYRVANGNAIGGNNIYVQMTTVDTGSNFHNWGTNTQLNPGESIFGRCWYNQAQGRYVISYLGKEANPTPTN
jgi:hypothetical protein